MLSVLIEGTLAAEPVVRASSNGNQYVTAKLRTAGANGEVLWCNLIAFNADAVQVLTGLKAGDALAIAGSAAISQWEGKDGHPRAGLNVTVARAMSVYAAGRQRKAAA